MWTFWNRETYLGTAWNQTAVPRIAACSQTSQNVDLPYDRHFRAEGYSRCSSFAMSTIVRASCHRRMRQPVLTYASVVVQLVITVDGACDGSIWCCFVSRCKCCVCSFKKCKKKREKYRRSMWVKDYLKSRNSRIMRDLEFNEDVLRQNFTRVSETNFCVLCYK